MAVAAVLDERRRMARDLHDGLAQELAYVVMQARRIAERGGGEDARRVADAAESALGESRQAIAALSRRPDEPFEDLVAQVAGRLTARAGEAAARDRPGCRAQLRSPRSASQHRPGSRFKRGPPRPGGGGEHLAHKQPRTQPRGGGRRRGFDLADAGSGFGLTTMRERAEALEGTSRSCRGPGGGTIVRVALP